MKFGLGGGSVFSGIPESVPMLMQVSSYKIIISSYLVDIIFSVLSSSGSVKILEEDQEHWSIIFVDPAE